jgi:selenium metabolism protein YedF
MAQESSGIVVYISSDEMGRGDAQLGRRLMATFLDTLSNFASAISHLVFVNAGVKLAVEGSPVLEQLQVLERGDITILCCGTCLNFFGIKDGLRAGTVSNMQAILETLTGAKKILSP